MTFRLEISMDNAAFEDDSELATILRTLANSIEGATGPVEIRLRDANGNHAGTATITED